MATIPSTSAVAPQKPVRAVGPRLRKLFYLVLALVSLLFANSAYLSIITFLEWTQQQTYQDFYYQYMFFAHLVLGLLLVLPLIVFGVIHWINSKDRRNRLAVRIGYALFVVSILVLVSGLLLTRALGIDLRQPALRSIVYWLHVACPLAAAWLYWLHRLVGPRIKWRVGLTFVGIGGAGVLTLVAFQMQDPRQWNSIGPDSGVRYFQPSLARTASGNFIPAKALMNDQYCLECHQDVHARWSESVHRFSSFNNPPYLASVSETREVSLKRDGSVQAARWCAGCHDPVPFFSGAFDDPKFDLLGHATSDAGITCTVCHAITNVNSVRGNADYTIEEPLHYPFAFSDNSALRWINQQLVKAKPAFHKKTFLKPLHKTAEFCSTCHKVHLPRELNHYKDFLRGQNHYDSYLLSGVSGHGARSFYYPPKAEESCNRCHMPLMESDDFGAQRFDKAASLSVHDHLFPSANTGIAWLRNRADVVKAHQEYLQGVMRLDIFGVRVGGQIDDPLIAPLRSSIDDKATNAEQASVPALQPGQQYLIETVIRTMKMGHLFTQGTVDSNEIWLDVMVRSGDRVIGRSGGLHRETKQVDPWSHFVNVFMLDQDGNRIDRRNAEDIFTPLYNHQIPPGAAQTVQYLLQLPDALSDTVRVDVKLQYRKFDQRYMQFVADRNETLGQTIRGHIPGELYVNDLPITTLASDSIEFAVEGLNKTTSNERSSIPQWQRWNDYGIGLLLKGKGELRQAEDAFNEVEQLGHWDGPMNLARVYNQEGRVDEAVAALTRANEYAQQSQFPRWTWAWLSGSINAQQGRLVEAVQNLRSVLEDHTADMQARGFDFGLDYEVINLAGQTLFELGNQRYRQQRDDEALSNWNEAIDMFKSTLAIDPENVSAHYNLQLLYDRLGNQALSDEHRQQHRRYKLDDNAQGRAIRLAREKYPAANHAAEAVVRYPLHRADAEPYSQKP